MRSRGAIWGRRKKSNEKLIKNRIRIVDIYFVYVFEKKNEMHKTPFVDLKMFPMLPRK